MDNLALQLLSLDQDRKKQKIWRLSQLLFSPTSCHKYLKISSWILQWIYIRRLKLPTHNFNSSNNISNNLFSNLILIKTKYMELIHSSNSKHSNRESINKTPTGRRLCHRINSLQDKWCKVATSTPSSNFSLISNSPIMYNSKYLLSIIISKMLQYQVKCMLMLQHLHFRNSREQNYSRKMSKIWD